MNMIKALLLVGMILFGLGNALAQPAGMRVRGAITGFDGHELQVKTREGKDLKVTINRRHQNQHSLRTRYQRHQTGQLRRRDRDPAWPGNASAGARSARVRSDASAARAKAITTGTLNPAPA